MKRSPWQGTRWKPEATEAASSTSMRDPRELRIYGVNAVQALFARRPQALRKLYLAESRCRS